MNNKDMLMINVLMDGDQEDVDFSSEDFEDSRVELRAMGHNLTSVLMMPRESILENLLDEFSTDQTEPLVCLSAAESTMSSSSSHHSSTHSMSTSSHGALISLSMYSSSSLDLQQLTDLIVRMRRIYEDYNKIHPNVPGHLNVNRSVQTTLNRFSTISSVIPSSAEDVAVCFKEVPEPFFRSDFTLQSPDIFTLTLGTRSQLFAGQRGDGQMGMDRDLKKSKKGLDSDNRQYSNGNSRQQDKLSRYLDLVEV